MVDAKEVKPTMRVSELALGIEKRWITRDSPVKQIDCLELLRCPGRRRLEKNFGARVKIKRADVGRRRTIDGVLFAWRKVGLQLFSNRLCDLRLNGEPLRQVAGISLSP